MWAVRAVAWKHVGGGGGECSGGGVGVWVAREGRGAVGGRRGGGRKGRWLCWGRCGCVKGVDEIVLSADPARAVYVQSPMHGVHTWPKVLV